jgi:hypothetical protein
MRYLQANEMISVTEFAAAAGTRAIVTTETQLDGCVSDLLSLGLRTGGGIAASGRIIAFEVSIFGDPSDASIRA